MPRRSILTERQRSALFNLPTDDASMLHHYTLADDNLEHINDRRRSENRIGFALQLCALRYPGRLITSDEVIPEKVLRFIAAQLGLIGDDILPGVTVIERLCADALVAAERKIESRIAERLDDQTKERRYLARPFSALCRLETGACADGGCPNNTSPDHAIRAGNLAGRPKGTAARRT